MGDRGPSTSYCPAGRLGGWKGYEVSAQWTERRIRDLPQFEHWVELRVLRLRANLPGILAHCRWPLGTNLVEGINNKIEVIKRMAHGFRDDAYLFLKIRAAFPGAGR